jgi:hypothetical protein
MVVKYAKCSGVDGRRTSGEANCEEQAFSTDVGDRRSAGVDEVRLAGNSRRVRTGAENAAGAGGAMLRGFQLAREIVVLEGSGA